MNRTAIIVAGMHRSGTSATTRVLNLLGASLSDELLPPVPMNNTAGFWESRAVVEIHDRFLAATGSTWRDLTPLDPDHFEGTAGEAAREQLRSYIRAQFPDAVLFAIKDPRFCNLAPLLLRVLDEEGIDACVVHPYRNPLEVAASLAVRDGMLRRESLLLWERLVLESEFNSRGRRRAFFAFDDLLADWRSTCQTISDQLAIPLALDSEALARNIDEFLDHDLRHHSHDDTGLTDAALPAGTRATYDALTALCSSPAPSSELMQRLDAMRAANLAGAREFGPLIKEMHENPEGMRHQIASLKLRLASAGNRPALLVSASAARKIENGKWPPRLLAGLLKRYRTRFGPRLRRIDERLALGGLPTSSDIPRSVAATQDIGLIRKSRLFDERYYRRQAGPLPPGRNRAIAHFLTIGAARNFRPNALFDPVFYAEKFDPPLAPGINPLVHYISEGEAEGRMPSRRFDPGVCPAPGQDPTGGAALRHYLETGAQAGRAPIAFGANSPLADVRAFNALRPGNGAGVPDGLAGPYLRAAVRSGRVHPLDLPPDFDPQRYLVLNPDVADKRGGSDADAVTHYLLHGRHEGRAYGGEGLDHARWLDSVAGADENGWQSPKSDRPFRAACLVHVYYPEVWPDLAAYAANFPAEATDVYVNIAEDIWRPDLHDRIHADFPDSRILVSPNLGMDIGGFLRLAATIDLDAYDAICLMHTKKSSQHTEGMGRSWLAGLLDPLCGTPACGRAALAAFHDDPELGFIGAARWRRFNLGDNARSYTAARQRLGIPFAHSRCDYLSGTMMMLSADLMKLLRDRLGDIALERAVAAGPGRKRDGQMAHGIERAIPALARARGRRMIWLGQPGKAGS